MKAPRSSEEKNSLFSSLTGKSREHNEKLFLDSRFRVNNKDAVSSTKNAIKKESKSKIFFGLPLNQQQVNQLEAALKQENPHLKDEVRWVRPGNHHVTLCFLGYIKQSKIPEIIDRVQEAISDAVVFSFYINKIDHFPSKRASLIAAYIAKAKALMHLHQQVENATVSCGISAENREYKAHITLARPRGPKKAKITAISFDDFSVEVNELILYESSQNEEGTIYLPLHRFNFTSL